MKEFKKEEWLTEIPKLIYKLKKNYGFYYNCRSYSRISRDILDVINPKKHKHKIVLYNKDNKFFVVVYRKNDTVIYYTNEYKRDTRYGRIRYFVNKFEKAYKKAEKELEDEIFNDNRLLSD
jgi:hypothetical protein